MAKKSDLATSFRDYSARCAGAAQAEKDRDFRRMLERAESTLPLLSEAIAYLRRYQKIEVPRLASIDLILCYAPPLFARGSLDAVERWIEQGTRAERRAYPEMSERVLAARRLMTLATRVWPSWHAAALEVAPGDNEVEVARLVDFWTSYGAIVRFADATPPKYQLMTHPKLNARGKCARCGHESSGQWTELLEKMVCSHCRATSPFVMTARLP